MRVSPQTPSAPATSASAPVTTWRQTRHVAFPDAERTVRALKDLRTTYPGLDLQVDAQRAPGGIRLTVRVQGPVAAARKAELIVARRGILRDGERAVSPGLSALSPQLAVPPSGGPLAPSPTREPTLGLTATQKSAPANSASRHVYWIGGGGDKESLYGYGPHFLVRSTKRSWEYSTPGEDSYWSYREGDAIVADILRKQEDGPTSISLVGHSLGAAEAMRITHRLDEHGIEVDQLITLDPVSMTFPHRPNNQRNWLNVYQKQSTLDRIADVPILGTLIAAVVGGIGMLFGKVSGADYIATLGNQLGHEKGADQNIPFDYDHAAVGMMYRAAHNALRKSALEAHLVIPAKTGVQNEPR